VIGSFRAIASQHRAMLLAFLFLAGAGLWLGLRLPAAILPEVTFPRITVIAESGERDTEEMLRGVTMPLEQAIRRVPGLHEMRSTTSRGSTEINLDFAWNSDMDQALQRVQALAGSIREELPAGTSLDARLMSPTLFPVLGLALTSPSRSQAELRDLAELRLRPELARLPGVSEVVLQGGARPEVRVTLDPAALSGRGLTVAEVADAIREATDLRSLGLHAANREMYLALVDQRPRNLDQLGALPVPLSAGGVVPLSALGRVEIADQPHFTRYASGGGEAVLINLLRQPAASTVTLADAVRGWLARNRGELPPDVRIEIFYDQGDLVRASIASVRDSLLVGALFAILIVTLFLGSIGLGARAAFLLPGSIGLSLLGLALSGQSLNLMTLGGIAAATGLVLDDAIVVVEHLAHEAAAGRPRSEALAALFPTLLASSLCSLAIFVPFALLGGVAGAFFKVLAISVVLMLAASLVLSVTLLPHFTGPSLRALKLPFEGLGRRGIGWTLDRPALVLGGAALLIVAGVILALRIESGFLPEMDEGALIVDYLTPPGTSLDETVRMLRPLERELGTTPEVESWSRRTGDQLGFFITEPNTGDYVLRLREKRRRSADDVADDLRERIEAVVPGVDVEFGQLIEDVVGDLTTNPHPIEVRVFSEDRPLGRSVARRAADLIARVPGVVDVRDGVVVSGPNLILSPSERGTRLGVDAAQLEAVTEPRIRGLEAGQVPRLTRVWPIRVTLPPAPADRLASLLETDALLPGGGRARLADVADSRVVAGDAEIQRDDQRTMVSVTGRLSARDLGSAMAEIQGRLRDSLDLSGGVKIEYAGLWAEQQSSFQGLTAVLILAAIAVLLILLVTFRSWSQSLAVVVTALASLSGVFIALRVSAVSFNLSSFVGAIMVVGIVSENAVFLVAEYRRERASSVAPGEAARLAARRRVRPILMTAAAGIAALLPLVVGWGSGSALLKPLAIAVVGGFTCSTPLLLLVLPTLLSWERGAQQVDAS
jgi:multidrug efflux pump subunit AcrB